MPEAAPAAAATAETPPASTTEPTTGEATPPETDWQAEAEKWKQLSKKNEDRAKSNATAAQELEKLRQSSMTEQEQAVAKAKAEGRAEALRDAGVKLVAAEVRVAALGRGVDVDALVEGIDPARFLTEDGEPDRAAITAWIDRVAPASEDGPKTLDLGQGTRTQPLALNGDPLERDLRSKLGIR